MVSRDLMVEKMSVPGAPVHVPTKEQVIVTIDVAVEEVIIRCLEMVEITHQINILAIETAEDFDWGSKS
jgi:hypothetical protein